MKRSIKRQIGGMFIILVGLALTAIWLCNYFFLEEFYVAQKIKILKTGVEQLNSYSIKELIASDSGFSQFCSANNLSIVVTSIEYSEVYTNVKDKDGNLLAGRLFGYITGIDEAKPNVLERTDQYVAVSYTHLDVYKRQLLSTSARVSVSGLNITIFVTPLMVTLCLFNPMIILLSIW